MVRRRRLAAMTLAGWLGVLGAPTACGAEAGTKSPVLPFIHDDFPRALAEAKGRGVPLFVESWAPW